MYIKDVLLKYVQFSKYDVFLKVCKEIFQARSIMLCYVMKVTLRYATICLCCMYDGMVSL